MKFFLLFFSALFSALVLNAQSADLTMAKANMDKAYDALNRRDFAAFIQMCDPGFTEYSAGPAPIKTPEAAVEAYKMFFTAFPDLKIQIVDIAAGANGRYYLKVNLSGTNTGAFGMMPPTGKSVNLTDVDIVEVNAAGKAVSHWSANSNGALNAIGYGSLANPATQAVMAAYGFFGKGDIQGILSICAENVVFDLQDRMFDSQARLFQGKAGVGQFFQELGAKFRYSKFQPLRFVADGEDVFILVEAEYTLVSTGKKYSSTYTHHFRIVDGKIAFFRGVDDFQMMK